MRRGGGGGGGNMSRPYRRICMPNSPTLTYTRTIARDRVGRYGDMPLGASVG